MSASVQVNFRATISENRAIQKAALEFGLLPGVFLRHMIAEVIFRELHTDPDLAAGIRNRLMAAMCEAAKDRQNAHEKNI